MRSYSVIRQTLKKRPCFRYFLPLWFITISIFEGNWYFPPEALEKEYFKPSDKHTTCFWKGLASYYKIDVDGAVNENGAWYYPALRQAQYLTLRKTSQITWHFGMAWK